jgi:ubiquinone/menaquinone biosynthesis C-methylase UbiE
MQYYKKILISFVKGHPKFKKLSKVDLNFAINFALKNQLKIHKFKKKDPPWRVTKILNMLKGFNFSSLLDIGSGRGVFLWPLINQFPSKKITTIDLKQDQVNDIQYVAKGGFKNLSAYKMDACGLEFADNSFDIITALEVIEHIEQPEKALKELFRVAKKYVILSVPSKEDNNKEHLHFFTKETIKQKLLNCNFSRVKIDFILNHMIILAKK